MADYDEGYEYEEEYADDNNIPPEDCWTVISSYFETKGLVSQQIDSFNDFQETNVENIYALGDACDRGFELTPVAIAAGRKLSDRVFGGKAGAKLKYANIPSVVFAHPEVGSIGLPEPEARKQYGDSNIKVYNSTFTDMYYSMMDQADKVPTSYKLVCAGPEEKVVGLHILGRNSSEVLQGLFSLLFSSR